MDEDDEAAAWAQMECEARQYHYLLGQDPAYLEWLEQFAARAVYEQEYEHEFDCER
jgi:hypothetical protein